MPSEQALMHGNGSLGEAVEMGKKEVLIRRMSYKDTEASKFKL